jgi:lipoyl(octanoyl) transferase
LAQSANANCLKPMENPIYQYQWLGQVPYEEAWAYQNVLADQVATGQSPPTLLLLEHPPTYTFGRRGNAENLLWDPAELDRRGIQVHWVDRGGDVTYHGPGQLVGYPIVPLANDELTAGPSDDAIHVSSTRIPQADFTGYLRKLEAVLIQITASFGIVSGQIPGLTGVWVQPDVHSRCKDCPPEERRSPAKLAAIGVKVDARGVSRHGFALNVDPNMSHWEGIVGCGLADYSVTSLAEVTHQPPSMEAVVTETVQAFSRVFAVEMAAATVG